MTAAIDGGPINIGQAARASGVSAKMVRHYESLGLLGEVARTDSGYRQYRAADVHTLRFIRRARELGFSMTEIAELVSLWHDRGRASADVKRIAQRHLAELEQRIVALQDMRRTLDDCCATATATRGPTARSWTSWPPAAHPPEPSRASLRATLQTDMRGPSARHMRRAHCLATGTPWHVARLGRTRHRGSRS